jgi:hypothetical protein
MKWILVFAVMAMGTFSRAEDPAQELIRLRKENAALKAEIVKLKEELAAARPPAPKATKYTPEMIVKLIPAEDAPVAGQKWDDAKRAKAKKILEAHLVGEWVQVTTPLEAHGDDAHEWMSGQTIPIGPTTVKFECKLADPAKSAAKASGATGRITRLNLTQTAPSMILIVLEDCQLVK